MKQCILYDRTCTECGECSKCVLDPSKICDNCGKCIEDNRDYAEIEITDVILDEYADADSGRQDG